MAEANHTCSVEDCARKRYARGLCGAHYQQQRRRQPLGTIRQYREDCEIRGCDRRHCARGLCQPHHQQAFSFRIDADAFISWLNSVDGCMICGRDRPLTIDHDHSCCGDVRRTCGDCNQGLLCRQCNTAIGMLGDDINVAKKAVSYLRRIG